MTFEPLAVDPREAAKMLGISPVSFYKLMAEGQIIGRKSGRRTLVAVDDIRSFLANLPAANIKFGSRKVA